MNERIDKLAEHAGMHRDKFGMYFAGDKHNEDGVDLEKFAELIVKEYEKLLPETCPWTDADKEGPMKGWHVQFVARKHFGVKE
jgi:hypothetical protein